MIIYDNKGRPSIRIDITGKAHGDVPTPHAHVKLYDELGRPQGEVLVGLRLDTKVKPEWQGMKDLLRNWLQQEGIPLP